MIVMKTLTDDNDDDDDDGGDDGGGGDDDDDDDNDGNMTPFGGTRVKSGEWFVDGVFLLI